MEPVVERLKEDEDEDDYGFGTIGSVWLVIGLVPVLRCNGE